MRLPAAFYVTLGVALTLGATAPGSASAQVPTAEPVAVPVRGAVIQTVAPTAAATPAAQLPSQPTAAPAAAEPAPVTAVTAPAPGVTTLPAAPQPTASSSQAATAAYTAGASVLTLDAVVVGPLRSVDGGGAVAEVITEAVGPGTIAKKHIGQVKYEDISIRTGLNSKPVIDWIAATWKQNYQRKNGSILGTDYNLTVRSERQFFNALITETTIPELNAASKDPAYLTVKIAPETIVARAGDGAKAPATIAQKSWLPSNFRFEMTGLDGSHVNRIESFTVRQVVQTDDIGAARDYQKEPAKLEFPNLKISIPEGSSQTWAGWFDDFVIKGNATEDKERDGAIVFLDPLMKNELGRVNLFNCGIFRLAPQPLLSNTDTIRRLTAELYCERMELAAAPK